MTSGGGGGAKNEPERLPWRGIVAAGWGPRLDAPVPGSPGLRPVPVPRLSGSGTQDWLLQGDSVCQPWGHSVGGVRARARCQSGLRPLRWDMDQLRDKRSRNWPGRWPRTSLERGWEAKPSASCPVCVSILESSQPWLAAPTRPRGSGPRPLRWAEGGGAGGWEGHLLDGGRGCPAQHARRGAWARSSGGGDPPGPGGAAAVSPQPP